METEKDSLAHHAHIRSFVLRQGRLTRAQDRALTALWSRFGVETHAVPIDITQLFGRCATTILEIGFGDGESWVTMADQDRTCNYLGIEVHGPGIGHALLRAEALGLTNLRIMRADAVEVLERQLPDASLDGVQIFFPDPWPKARHHKRRLIQPPFVDLIARRMKPGGYLHIATDCETYAVDALDLLNKNPHWVNQAPEAGFIPRPSHRPLTKFERRAQRLGHGVWDMRFSCCVVPDEMTP